MADEDYSEYLKKQSYDDLVAISHSVDKEARADLYQMVLSEMELREKRGEKLESEKAGSKRPLTFWQSILVIIVGVILYLIDCQVFYKLHPDVPWIQSGIYANWGFLFDIGCVLVGVYGLAKLCE